MELKFQKLHDGGARVFDVQRHLRVAHLHHVALLTPDLQRFGQQLHPSGDVTVRHVADQLAADLHVGLAEQLGISRREAAEFIDTYFEKFPKIRTYMNSLVEFCEKNGYVPTICGRRRTIPQIHDKNRMMRECGKRAAMNAPIQGSAADLIKIAMIHIDRMMKEAGVRSKMILQVHDELIFDVPEDETERMKELIVTGMVNAMKLKVPLTVECSVGKNWYEAK